MTNLFVTLLFLAAQAGRDYTVDDAPWRVQNDGAGDRISAWAAPYAQPTEAQCVSNAAAAQAWFDALPQRVAGSVAYSGSVSAGTHLEVQTVSGAKLFAIVASDSGELLTVPAAESPHKTPAEIAALFRAETNALPSLAAMMQAAGVGKPEARWYVTNTVTDSAMTTAQRNLSEKIARVVTRWQMLRAWREARQ